MASPPANPNWTREEVLLALDLYLRHRGTLPSADHVDVIELSALLNRLGEITGIRTSDRFRNPNGVAMKLANFAAIDPEYAGKGLSAGGKLERDIWHQYIGNPEAIIREAQDVARKAGRPASKAGFAESQTDSPMPAAGMDLGITGRRVLITGGSKGIGLACAESFAEAGCDIILVSRSAEKLAAAADALRAKRQVNVTTFAADLSKPEERERLHAAHADPDILVNNAGAIPAGRLQDIGFARWQEAWSLKVLGYIHMCQLYMPGMEAKRAGVICNIIGMAGRAPRAGYICGGTGNAALIAFTSALGGAAQESGVRVFGINPAATATDRMITQARVNAKLKFGDEERWAETLTGLPYGRPIEAQEIADLAAFLSSPRGAYVNGTVVDVDGGGMFR